MNSSALPVAPIPSTAAEIPRREFLAQVSTGVMLTVAVCGAGPMLGAVLPALAGPRPEAAVPFPADEPMYYVDPGWSG